MSNNQQFIKQLAEQQLVPADVKLDHEIHTPWYIKVLLAFAGWLAALFFFGFFAAGLMDLMDSVVTRAVIGTGLLFSAYFILRAPKSQFFEHLGLAVSLNGQVLLAWALFEHFGHTDWMLWFTCALLQMALAWLMPSFLHRVFSSFFAAYALSVVMALWSIAALFSSILMFICTWLWLREFSFKQHFQRLKAIAYGLTIAMIMIKSANTLDWLWMEQGQAPQTSHLMLSAWLDEGLNCLILLYLAWHLLQRYQVNTHSTPAIITLVATLFIGLASMQAAGLAVAMLIMVLGFAASHRVLLGLGVLSGLFYIAKYYYSLELSLTQKSLSLLILGVILLLFSKLFALWWLKGGHSHE
ncbi:DUF4401 domain-containing protein [Paraglaciecola sp. MB-3u-78]|uniref:DUF4401 domain-containing protein n=1 Tax=Paraglaciecola sp. MB-3u-78 TaxID=2058332 RepID=UPI000C327C13|nr:DUF4401 domain-containing protein [Paraglaciecola sp. MB-3u-78]PKG97938.1 hypothetical protein CXF95_16110 [Paraglaciecola sp. MB-3u-78]